MSGRLGQKEIGGEAGETGNMDREAEGKVAGGGSEGPGVGEGEERTVGEGWVKEVGEEATGGPSAGKDTTGERDTTG